MEHHESAVSFPTRMRAHIALACADVERSTAFYAQLLGQEPTKVREGYAKFEVLEPPLNLTLNATSEAIPAQRAPAHFGIQVKSTGEVMTQLATMKAAGFATRTEAEVGCCYAVQDKIWVRDPDGNDWEVFVVTEADIPEYKREGAGPEPRVGPERDCCPPSCCA